MTPAQHSKNYVPSRIQKFSGFNGLKDGRHIFAMGTFPRQHDATPSRMVIDTNVNGSFLMARAITPHLIRVGWGRIINVSVSHSTMRRRGLSLWSAEGTPPPLESETLIWAQDLRGTGVTVNALLPGGATLTGMIPDTFPANARGTLLDTEIMVPPLLWLVSEETNAITSCRVTANRWEDGNPLATTENAGWGSDPMVASVS